MAEVPNQPPERDPRIETILAGVKLCGGLPVFRDKQNMADTLTWDEELNTAVLPSGFDDGQFRALVFHSTTENDSLFRTPQLDFSLRVPQELGDEASRVEQRRNPVVRRVHGDGFYTANRREAAGKDNENNLVGVFLSAPISKEDIIDQRHRLIRGILHLGGMVLKESIAPHIPGIDTAKFAERSNRKLTSAGAKVALINMAPRWRAGWMNYDFGEVSPQYLLLRTPMMRIGEATRREEDFQPQKFSTLKMYGYGFWRAAFQNARAAKKQGIGLLH